MEEFDDYYSEMILNLLLKDPNKCFIGYNKQDKAEFFKGNAGSDKFFGGNGSHPLYRLLASGMLIQDSNEILGKMIAEAMSIEDINYDYYRCARLFSEKDNNRHKIDITVSANYKGYVCIVSFFENDPLLAQPVSSSRAPFPVETVLKMIDTYDRFAIIQFDINNFKLINQKYGETFGDEILNHVLEIITSMNSESFIGSRFGADIFTIFTKYETKEDLISRIRMMQNTLSHYKNVEIKYSFGIYLVEDKTIPLRDMTDFAAIARKKNKGKLVEPIYVYNKKDFEKLTERHEIESEMTKGLENNEFQIYLQPKCEIDTGKIVGAEALVRWIHPEKGIIPPMEFIPLFEKNEFIETLDMYVCELTCKTIRSWIDRGLTPIPISFNISRVYLGNAGLVEKINNIINKYNLPKNLVEIEITETFDNPKAEQSIRMLKNSGYTLLMDDFGSGFSSLNTLRNACFDIVKIDRGFMDESMLSEIGKKVISHTIDMTLDIGMDIIAEGIENRVQADFLFESGCKTAQGYLFSRPVPIMEFEKMVFKD